MSENTGVRVRWLLAGAFSAAPAGNRFSVHQASFAKALEDAALTVTATVQDRLGDKDSRAVTVSFPSLRAFGVNEVVAAVPALKGLAALAAALGSADAAKRPDPQSAVDQVLALVGEGRLAAGLRAKLGVAAPAAGEKPAAAPAADSGNPLDDLLDGAVVSAPKTEVNTPKGFLDNFVKAIRPGSAGAANPTLARGGRDLIEAETYATAVDVLKSPEVAAVEGAWRALKLVADHVRESSGMVLDVIDVAPAGVVDAVGEVLPTLPEDESPDAIFVLDAVNDADGLLALANLGADHDIPVVSCVSHRLFGVDDPQLVSARVEEEDGSLKKPWHALREDEATRWLAVVTNRVVFKQEGNGPARRAVLGSPVAAVAAMLANSYDRSGNFAKIVGAPGAIKSPGSWDIPSGREAGMVCPTEAFYSVRAQSRLGQLGIIGLGSPRNSENILLTSTPMVRGGEDVVPLSAQILTGRVVRLARWVRGELPAGCAEADVMALFESAVTEFLFPSAKEAVTLKVQVVNNPEGAKGRTVVLQVSVRADQAGIPFHLGFGLPLRD